jgi:hypothetical protein
MKARGGMKREESKRGSKIKNKNINRFTRKRIYLKESRGEKGIEATFGL